MSASGRRAVIVGVADAPLRKGVLATPATPVGVQAVTASAALAEAA